MSASEAERAPSPPIAIGSLVLVMAIWGSTFAVTKSALEAVPPFLLALLRFGLASAVLVPLAVAAGRRAGASGPLPWGRFALLGLTGVTLFFVAFNLALDLTTAADGALIQGAIPAATALLAAATLGERPGRGGVLGVACSLVGVALVVWAGRGEGGATNRPLGDAVMVGAVLAWAVYTVLGRQERGGTALVATAASTALGTLFLLPFAAYDLVARPPAGIPLGTWLAVGYLGLVASALAYLLWNRALGVLGAGQAAVFVNLVPVVGVATAALALGEPLSAAQLGGGALVLVGVVLSLRQSGSRNN